MGECSSDVVWGALFHTLLLEFLWLDFLQISGYLNVMIKLAYSIY